MNSRWAMVTAIGWGIGIAVTLTGGVRQPGFRLSVPVDSQGIREAVYHPARERLVIYAVGGGGWVFDDVPLPVFCEFLGNHEPGVWLARYGRRTYPCRQVRREQETRKEEERDHAIR